MHNFLRICGGVGLVVGMMMIVACCVASLRIDGAVCQLTDDATHAIEVVRAHVADADAQLNTLNQAIGKALESKAEELAPEELEITRKVEQRIRELRQHVGQVSVALEKTLTIVDILRSMGLNMDGHRVRNTLEKTDQFDQRLAEFSTKFEEVTSRFRPDGSLRETVVDQAKQRTLVAVEKVLVPTGILIDEINQVADNATQLVSQIRSRIRWTIFWVTTVLVLLMGWLTLGQFALMQNGLRPAVAPAKSE
ncbi:hypothetical protein AB1K70_23590 [Bremerella sp. JC770]|uniref:hypothetical protein n=1 Tax=Bremerella sp. JC770 TaxID=3232137 RepID=UPI00345A06F9